MRRVSGASSVMRSAGHQMTDIPDSTSTWTSRGPRCTERRRQRRLELVAPGDGRRLDAVARRRRRDVEPGQVERRRALDLLQRGEPLEDRVVVVAQHEELDRHLVGRRGPERGDRVLRRALAEHADDRDGSAARAARRSTPRARSRARRRRRSSRSRDARSAAGCAARSCSTGTRARRSRRPGRRSLSVAWTAPPESGSPGAGSSARIAQRRLVTAGRRRPAHREGRAA